MVVILSLTKLFNETDCENENLNRNDSMQMTIETNFDCNYLKATFHDHENVACDQEILIETPKGCALIEVHLGLVFVPCPRSLDSFLSDCFRCESGIYDCDPWIAISKVNAYVLSSLFSFLFPFCRDYLHFENEIFARDPWMSIANALAVFSFWSLLSTFLPVYLHFEKASVAPDRQIQI